MNPIASLPGLLSRLRWTIARRHARTMFFFKRRLRNTLHHWLPLGTIGKQRMYTIGQLAKHALVTVDAVRLYERQGLIAAAGKTSSGYRLYSDAALRRLAFIKHSQLCGFSLAEIQKLIRDPRGDTASIASVYRLALEMKAQVEKKIAALQAMAGALSSVIAAHEDGSASPGRRAAEGSSLPYALEAIVKRAKS